MFMALTFIFSNHSLGVVSINIGFYQSLIGCLTGPHEDKAWYAHDLPMENM